LPILAPPVHDGNTVEETKKHALAAVLKGVEELNFGDF
jgi:hypothetical protein